MFFDFSEHKVLFLSAITSMLGIALFFYVLTSGTWHALHMQTKYASEREWSEFTYYAQFKLPQMGSTLFAGAGFAGDASASTLSTTSSAHAAGIPVLLYHGEGAAGSMPLPVFVDQMRALKAAGWQTITLQQFTDFMKHGTPLPEKSFLLTFDDGRKDTFYPVDPVLKDLGYHAVMFVITGFSLPKTSQSISTFYLDKTELAYMIQSGRWELESHGAEDHRVYDVPTATSTAGHLSVMPGEHFLSNLFWVSKENRLETTPEYTARVDNDLASSKETLENQFGISVDSFAYPFNDFGQDTANFPGSLTILKRVVPAHYTFAFYQTWAGNGDSYNYPDPNQFFIKRIEPANSWSGSDLLAALTKGQAKTLPYKATTFGDDWASSWGSVQNGPTLSLSATKSTTGATAFLNGTEGWTDYTVTASFRWIAGQNISLIARHTDQESPYLACALSKDHIFVEEHSTGSTKILASSPYTFAGDPNAVNISLSVAKGSVTCASSGGQAQATIPSEVPTSGSIGVEAWDHTPGVAALNLKSIEARAL